MQILTTLVPLALFGAFAMGGTMGAMAIGLDHGNLFEASTPIHERVGQVLATRTRACQ